MDAIEMLTNDHNKVRELFKKFNGGGGITGLVRRAVGSVSGRERQQALERVCTELEMHTRIEEEVFYPAVTALRDQELVKQVKEALREHAKVKQEVSRLQGVTVEQPGIEARVATLERDVEHHATEEENEMFPRLEELMPDEQRRELATRMRAFKQIGSASKRARSGSAGRKKPAPRRAKASGAARARANRKHAGHGRSKKRAQRGGKR
jgi:iron-sulfur cluster repair protein YtfE (RIC family)